MSYRKGVRAEKKSRAWLEERGYFVVEARGSHGPCDLVALGESDVLVVQVKAGRKVTPGQMAEIRQGVAKIPRMSGYQEGRISFVAIRAELHYWPDYAREPIVTRL